MVPYSRRMNVTRTVIHMRATFSGVILHMIVVVVMLTPLAASAAAVSQVADWRDYLRLVSWSVHGDYRPILLADRAAATSLAGYMGGDAVFLDSAAIDALVAAAWPDITAVVVTGEDRRLATVAAAIAAALDRPLRLEPAPSDGDPAAIVVGAGPAGRLRDLPRALAYYDSLADGDAVVLCADDDFTFLAAAVAARHRAALSIDLDAAAARHPRSLTWVVDPRQVSTSAVRRLYRANAVDDSTGIYGPAIGVITAHTPTDASALLARIFGYEKLQGAWRHHLAVCNANAPADSSASRNGPWTTRRVDGSALNAEGLNGLLCTSAYVNLGAHGSPMGFMLAGENWPDAPALPATAPLVFVGESCTTADVASTGVERSIALRMIGAGAVAYVGSLEIGGVAIVGDLPFAACTPGCPLGEHVRLQSAARMDVLDDWPHALLIGDPLFYQLADERVECRLLSGTAETVIEIGGAADSLATAIAVDLPASTPVTWATVETASGSVTYSRGWPRPLAAVPSADGLRLLIPWSSDAGTLTVHVGTPPLSLRLLAAWDVGRTGVKGLLNDMTTMSRSTQWVVFAITALLVMVAAARIRRSERSGAALLVSVFVGAGVGVLAVASHASASVAAATGGGAAALAALLDLRRAHVGRVVAALGLFLAPLLVALGLLGMMGVSTRLAGTVAAGIGLLALAFLVSYVLGRLVLAAAPRLAAARSTARQHR